MPISLRNFTNARVDIGRTGNSLTTKELLDFRLAHARAQDAVHSVLNVDLITQQCAGLGKPYFVIRSACQDRKTYIVRPDLGRILDATSREDIQLARSAEPLDLAIVLCDGLSSFAVEQWSFLLLQTLLPLCESVGISTSPLLVAQNARVALGDEIGESLDAQMVLILIGERPGLASADSLGAYLTYAPRVGITDEARNCISNIRSQGLNPELAAHKIFWLLTEALRRKLTGTQLKEESSGYRLV